MTGAPSFALALFVSTALATTLGCSDGLPPPTRPSLAPLGAQASPSSTSPVWTSGTFTETSVNASRTVCSDFTSGIGATSPLQLGVVQAGGSVTLFFWQGTQPPTVADLEGDSPQKFVGTRSGDGISASVQDLNFAIGCPADPAPTPEVGGTLTAAVSGDRISGNYDEVYGSGASQVTFSYRFEAAWPASSALRR